MSQDHGYRLVSDTHKKTGLGFLHRERVSRRGFAPGMRFFLEIDLNESLLVKSNVEHAKISSSVAVAVSSRVLARFLRK